MKRFLFVLATLTISTFLVGFSLKWNPMRIPDNSSGETVVVLHGLGRSNMVTKTMTKRLYNAGYNVQQVGYKSLIGETPEDVVQDITQQINACCAELTTPVHFVGHSLGGLLVRAYLGENTIPGLGKVILLGSPNKGTPIVDDLQGKWVLELAGDMAKALGTDDSTGFLASLKAPTYPLGVIAGVADAGRSEEIPGDDDGLVPLESTKVEGMRDFIVLPVSHMDMRKDEATFAQILSFLKDSKFDHAAAASLNN